MSDQSTPVSMPDFGPGFHGAGRCSMYLLWLESRINDFLCIRSAQKRNDEAVLREYNEMRRARHASRTYEKQVSKWARKTFGRVLDEFLDEWPEYRSDKRVSHAFKIARIHRNAFAHAYMGTGDRLVFVPDERTRKLIEQTGLPIKELMKGNNDFSLLLPCLHEPFVLSFFENVKIIDFTCFRYVAEELGMNYAGTLADPNWPVTEGIDPVTLRQRP